MNAWRQRGRRATQTVERQGTSATRTHANPAPPGVEPLLKFDRMKDTTGYLTRARHLIPA